ncbi:MAG TPA: hypothetical protein VGE97_07270 [Nitrososphaera sp.]
MGDLAVTGYALVLDTGGIISEPVPTPHIEHTFACCGNVKIEKKMVPEG